MPKPTHEEMVKEILRLRLIDWQSGGFSRVPALSGAEQLLADLKYSGFIVVKLKD